MLPPPAESLYSLPRRLNQPQPSIKVTPLTAGSSAGTGTTASNSLSTEQLIAGKTTKDWKVESGLGRLGWIWLDLH